MKGGALHGGGGGSPQEGTEEKSCVAKPNIASAVGGIIMGNPVLALGPPLTLLDMREAGRLNES